MEPPLSSFERPDLSDELARQYHIGAIPSLLGAPYVVSLDELDAVAPDVALIGAPFDLGVSHRPGARFGPRALRALAYESGSYHLSHGLEISDWLTVVDHGDAHCPGGLVTESLANIQARVHAVATRGILPVTVGGDHTIVWPALTAVAEHLGYHRIGMLHFDAHADTAPEVDGAPVSHGTPMCHLVESGAVRADRFAQIGLRSHWPDAEVWDWMHARGIRSYLMDDVLERGILAVTDEAIAHVTQDCDAVYLSVDIDCLDPAFAPGTGTPEAGGLQARELYQALRRIATRVPLVGMDLVEVSPAYDHADVTVNSAHHALVEVLAGLAAVRRDAAGVAPSRPARGA